MSGCSAEGNVTASTINTKSRGLGAMRHHALVGAHKGNPCRRVGNLLKNLDKICLRLCDDLLLLLRWSLHFKSTNKPARAPQTSVHGLKNCQASLPSPLPPLPLPPPHLEDDDMREESTERGVRILTKLLSRPAVRVTRVAGFFKQPYLRAFMGPRLQSNTWEHTSR